MDAKHNSARTPHAPPPKARREYLELWIALSRRRWGSLVLVPADRDGSTADVANALADIGQRLSYDPVTAITVSSLEYGSALALADLQQHLNRERRSWAEPVVAGANGAAQAPATPAPTAQAPDTRTAAPKPAPGGSSEPAPAPAQTEALMIMPPARLIISVPPVVTEPLGLAAAQNADAVVLAVRMNRSRLAEVRRTVELVGREQVMGCFILR